MKFLYRGVLKGGEVISGELDVSDRKRALHVLIQRKICVLELREKQISKSRGPFLRINSRKNTQLNLEDTVRFFEKLFNLLNAQLTLSESISSIIKNSSNVYEKRLLQDVLQELHEGASLSEALNKFYNFLSSNMLCILNVGEVTGNLPHAIWDIIKILRRKIELKKNLTAALSYPLLICVMSLCVIGLFIFYLIPNVENMMRNLGGELPIITRLLITSSCWIMHDSWIVLLFFVICFAIYRILYRYPDWRLQIDRLKSKLPVIGKIEILYLQVTITNMLAGLLSSGIDIAQAMKMPIDSANNEFFKRRYAEAQAVIMDGAPVAQTLQKFKIIDGSIRDILAVGEKIGRLGDAFVNAANICENRLDNFLKKLVANISVIALLLVFSLVAILTLSIVSSVLNFSTNLAH